MQIGLLVTMLSLGVTSLVSLKTTILGFYLMVHKTMPLGGLFGLFLAVFGLYSSWHLMKSSYLSRGDRMRVLRFVDYFIPF